MIESDAIGQIIIGLVGIGSTIATGLMAILLANARRRNQETLRQKDLQLEQARQARERAEAESTKIKAEAASIVAEAKVKELNAEREKNQAAQNSALQYNWQTMLERAFTRMAASDERDYEIKSKLVDVMSQHTDTSSRLASYVEEGMKKLNEGQVATQTSLTEFHVTLIGVDNKVAPVQEMVVMLKQLVATSAALLDLAQVQAQAESESQILSTPALPDSAKDTITP